MRVLLVSPYSLSVFGGVQGQVLGLARSLRELGVDARVVAPCDGPPPERGIVTVGPSTNFSSNGSIAPIAGGKPVARRTLEARRVIDAGFGVPAKRSDKIETATLPQQPQVQQDSGIPIFFVTRA